MQLLRQGPAVTGQPLWATVPMRLQQQEQMWRLEVRPSIHALLAV
jgi:hypothetical protein